MLLPPPPSAAPLSALPLPPGYGFRSFSAREIRERGTLFDCLLLWEPPRPPGKKSAQYILSADIADGLGQDRSVATVIRLPTIEYPAEEVAQYISDTKAPSEFAYILDALGHLYTDSDGLPAMAAIECNNHGLSCQDTLQLHLGYPHFYRWETLDAADPSKRFTARIGWMTTPRTRPILLDKFYEAVTRRDPLTSLPDLVLNSPHTLEELPDFQTQGALWEAEAARGAHDDCILSAAIGYYVAWRQAGGELEPIGDRRRRRQEELATLQQTGIKRDYRNTGVPAWAADAGLNGEDLDQIEYDLSGIYTEMWEPLLHQGDDEGM